MPPRFDIHLDRELCDDELGVIFIDTPAGQLHVAGKVVTFDQTLLEIEDVLIYGRDGLAARAFGHAMIYQIAHAVMELLDVREIKISGWRSSGARPNRPSRPVTFRR